MDGIDPTLGGSVRVVRLDVGVIAKFFDHFPNAAREMPSDGQTPLMVRETVAIETFVRLATSWMLAAAVSRSLRFSVMNVWKQFQAVL